MGVLLRDAEVDKKSGTLGFLSAHEDVLGFDIMMNEVMGMDIFKTGYLQWVRQIQVRECSLLTI